MPSSYPTIPDAIAASSPGDIVKIAAGIYPAFDCAKGLTFRAATPGEVTFDMTAGTGVSMHFAAPPGQTIHVVGVKFLFPPAHPSFVVLVPEVDVEGRCVFENCILTGGVNNGRGSLHVNTGALVSLQISSTRGPVIVGDGPVTAAQCSFVGPDVLGSTSAAVLVRDTLRASHGSIWGGSSHTQPGGPALDLAPGAAAWVSNSNVVAGAGVGAVCVVGGTGTFEHARCWFSGPVCHGAPTPLLGAERLEYFHVGGAISVRYHTEPGYPVGVFASFELVDVALPFFAQPWSAPLGGSFAVSAGVADGIGTAWFNCPIPLNSALVDLPVWLHGFAGLGFPLQVAPPVGGLIR